MSNQNPANPVPTHSLPERANLEHLRNEAKQRLKAMRIDNPGATLAAAQFATARLYGFTSWRRLVAYVKAQTDPYSLANRILAVADHAERASRFKTLAQAWDDPEIAFQWARQNL